ncbi:MAG: AAA family ATPase [Paludibacteraceae bacterium]|nr:AAA family ATPase [Paludibacteraceae bacterium]
MIDKIEIKSIVPYTNGLTICNLHKINYIYGANATGKTTLSHYLENPNEEKYSGCSIEWENGIEEKILVYNKFFRENNFGNTAIPGVFTLGQATKEQQEEITKKSKELEELNKQCIQKKDVIDKLSKERDDLIAEFQNGIWSNIYKKHQDVFSSAFEGVRNSKDRFKQKVLEEYNNNTSELKAYDELAHQAQIVFQQHPIVLEAIQQVDSTSAIEIENNEIWSKKIIGTADVEIAKLINRLNISDWVHEGKKHLENNSNICPFCQKETIDDDFRKQIELFFDESFTSDVNTIKSLKDTYNIQTQNIISALNNIEVKEKQNPNSKLNIELFSSYVKTLYGQINLNKEQIEKKITEPSRVIRLTSNENQIQLISKLILDANNEIENHNSIMKNLSQEKVLLIKCIWRFLLEENKTQIDAFKKKENGLERGIGNLKNQIDKMRNQYRGLDSEIKTLNKKVTSVQPTIDEINKTLITFGFTNFKIVPALNNENQYQIQRESGENATSTLSEGETTFITLLYFLQRVKGGDLPDNVNDKRVVVIDDPISSLDSNILFVVSSLIKEIIEDIRNNRGNIQQMIVLTHNVYFHKELSNLSLKKGEHGKQFNPYYWILRKSNNETSIMYYEQECPIKSSYDLLWKELRESSNTSCIAIQNIMRRIIESYFKTWGGYDDRKILDKIDNPQEKEICRSLIYMINDGSHCVPDDLFVEQENELIDKYKNVFRLIFEKLGHIEHYNMMMQLN